jgi:hypothetical protein
VYRAHRKGGCGEGDRLWKVENEVERKVLKNGKPLGGEKHIPQKRNMQIM